MCADGYGSGGSNSCHRCDNTKAHLLIATSALFSLVALLLLFLAVVFLIGGFDAINSVRQSVDRTFSVGAKAPTTRRSAPVQEYRMPRRPIASPAHSFAIEVSTGGGGGGGGGGGDGGDGGGGGGNGRRIVGPSGRNRVVPMRLSGLADTDWTFTRDLGRDNGVAAGAQSSDEMTRYPSDNRNVGMSTRRQVGISPVSSSGAGRVHADTTREADAGGGGDSTGGGLGAKIKRTASRLPLNKLKILVVVWQILAVFSGITGIEFPASYSRFLSWISVVNLDIGSIFSASCVFPSVNFYVRLLVTTLVPLVLAIGLVLTYQTAKRRAANGLGGVKARKAAWSRHVAAGLLLTFFVSSCGSASTVD